MHACAQCFLKSFVSSLVSSTYKESLSACVAWFLTIYWFIEFTEFQKDTNWFFMLPGKAILNFCLFLSNISLKKKRFSLHCLEGFTESYITKNTLKLYFVCYLKWKMLPLKTVALCHFASRILYGSLSGLLLFPEEHMGYFGEVFYNIQLLNM